MAFASLYISKLSRRSIPPDPSTTSSYATRRADKGPPLLPPQSKKERFLNCTPKTSHGMIKSGRANSPNTPQQKDGSFAPAVFILKTYFVLLYCQIFE